MKTIHTYKGYKILTDFSKPVKYNVVDKNGLILNKNTNMYSCEIQTKNKKSTHIHCHLYESNNQEKFAYIEKEIDKDIEYRKKDIQKRFIEHRQSSMIEYIFYNLKITVINTPYNFFIYVNDNPLRLSYLRDIDINNIDSIMYYVHTTKVALYNATPLYKQKTNLIQNKKTIYIDCALVPIYNYIGNIFKYKERLFVLTNVSKNYSDNMLILEAKPLDNLKEIINIEIISPSEIYNQIKLYENKLTDNYLIDFICLKNKINFFE